MNKRDVLKASTFGQRVAEDETAALSTYFVETDHWERIYRGEIDVVYGSKGAGKSALYALLLSRSGELFDKNILLVAAENPRGAPAFRDIRTDPPTNERAFVGLWKLYFASLLHNVLAEYGIRNDASIKLEEALSREGLIKGSLTLAGLLRTVWTYVRSAIPSSIEGGVEIDPTTLLAKGFNGKITFSEPSKESRDSGAVSVDYLFNLANLALSHNKVSAWILIDRLDVAFLEDDNLEANALRALFRVYLDLLEYEAIRLKIFLRNDIWARITAEGFREASHVTRSLTIRWDRNSLLNLVVKRALHNTAIREMYKVTQQLSSQLAEQQEAFFYRLCPEQVDTGQNKSKTYEWILARTRDGTGTNAPREIIHFLNSLRDTEIKRLEVGNGEPEGENIFNRTTFKEALFDVSKTRLEQTIYAEFPIYKDCLEKLRGERTSHTLNSLGKIWNISNDEATSRANMLVEIGFFELRGSKQDPEFWIPFLYRDSLDLVQGTSD